MQEMMTFFSFALGQVERLISGAEQVFIGRLIVLGNSDTDAAGDFGLKIFQTDIRNLLVQEVAFFIKGIWWNHSLKENDKFISAKASDDVSRTEKLREQIADSGQQLVSGIVPQTVVDGFKIINVKDQKRAGLRGKSRILQVSAAGLFKSLFV